MRSYLLALATFCTGAACTAGPQPQPEVLATLTVSSGRFDRTDSLVSIPLEVTGPVHLVETTNNRSIPTPSQYDPTFLQLTWILEGDMQAGDTRTFTVLEGPDPSLRNRVSVHDPDGRVLEVRVRGERVLRYNAALVRPPTLEIPQVLARNAYLHPVWAPSGRSVTDDFSPDLAHQRGIFLAWTRTRLEDRTPDFWNLGDETGAVRLAGLGEQLEGPVFGGFRTHHQHVDLSNPEGEQVVLEETWDLRVFALGGRNNGFFLFDITSNQTNVTSSTLFLPEYHYGGMAVRATREWEPEILSLRTATGKIERTEADSSREHWLLMEGLIGDPRGGPAGIAVFSHPQNFRSPQPLRVHPDSPYFAFSPQRVGDMQIDPGKSLTLRYRFLVYDGSPQPSLVDSYWQDYAEPPEVRMLPTD